MPKARLSSSSLPRRDVLRGALALALGGTGCGYLKAEFARANAITEELDAYVFKQPFAIVWEKVTNVKGPYDMHLWDGTYFAWNDVSPTKKATTPKVKRDEVGKNEVRLTTTVFTVEGESLPTGCRVHYTKSTREVTVRDGKDIGSPNESTVRDTSLELELVRMFDPEGANRIEAAGEAAARSGEWYPKKKT